MFAHAGPKDAVPLLDTAMAAFRRPFYILIHTPVELARPIQLGVFRTSAYYQRLYEEYRQAAEAERKAHGTQHYFMPKQMAQNWTPYLPSGLRAQILHVEIPLA